jgi:hypothetical protein
MAVFSRVTAPAKLPSVARSHVVQRCASCGGKTSGECESCRKKKQLQRKAASRAAGTEDSFDAAPALTQGGLPLPTRLRGWFEPRFATDFSNVRIHDDALSHRAAQEIDARAFTLGQHIHFAAGELSATGSARPLIAHELVHTIQQRGLIDDARVPVTIDAPDSAAERDADRVSREVVHAAHGHAGTSTSATTYHPPSSAAPLQRVVQRVGFWETLSRFFGQGTFSDKELLDYLKYLDDHAAIEGDYDSDNKAREIIKRWRAGDKLFKPTLTQKQLMLLELIDGPTGDDDEHAILELLRGSTDSEVVALVGAAGGEGSLKSEFHWSESDELDAFLENFHKKPAHRPVAGTELEQKKVAIREIVVNQTTPQVVTVTYTDGRTESNTCSAGKGTCCVEPGDSGGPTAADTTVNESNWTPIGTHVVQFKQEDHAGVKWWTQFNSRAIALHEYTPVDGTPLSHGCVRLHGGFARRIYEGARPGRTRVIVKGIPRPRCDHGALQAEWANDFSKAGSTPTDGEERSLRRHLSVAFGHPGDKELDKRIAEKNIPRCRGGRRMGRKP